MRSAFARVAAALVVVAVAIGSAVVLAHQGRDPSPRSGRAETSRIVPGRVVQVETGVSTTTFLPLGPGPADGRTLSAQRAYNVLVSGTAKLSPIPPTVQPYYGVLTDTSTTPAAVNLRVWAFTVETGCIRAGAPPPLGGVTPTPTPSPTTRCRLWEFVNATTGHHLGVISEEVLPD